MVEAGSGSRANRARTSLALSQFTVPLPRRIEHAFDGDVVVAIVLGEVAHHHVEAWLASHLEPGWRPRRDCKRCWRAGSRRAVR